MAENLIKTLDRALSANMMLAEAYEEEMVNAMKTNNQEVFQYYGTLREELVGVIMNIDNEFQKLKG